MFRKLFLYPKTLLGLCAAAGVAVPAVLQSANTDDQSLPLPPGAMRYEVTFVPSWNPATHPVDYPITHRKKGLLTPAIGATHAPSFKIFCPGTTPTPGLERLSEMGKHDPLDQELMAAREKGQVGELIRFADGSPGPVHAPIRASLTIDAEHCQVSIVGMIAPSPDWFYGVSAVDLRKDGKWIPTLAVPAYAWDSGGDGGNTYLAEDQDLNPKQPTQRANGPQFMRDGEACPVGHFLFKLVPSKS